MKANGLMLPIIAIVVATLSVQAQSPADSSATPKKVEKKYQARAPKTQPFGAQAFAKSNQTIIRWLGFAGFFINSRGTTMMVDPEGV